VTDEEEPLRLSGERWAQLTTSEGVGPAGLLLLPLASLLVRVTSGVRKLFHRIGRSTKESAWTCHST
jgi:hypothetical protein